MARSKTSNHEVSAGEKKNSSRLREDPPPGDTGAPAVATMPHGDSTVKTATTTSATKSTRGTKRRKAKSLLRRYKSFSLRNTWFNPLLAMFLILALYYVNPGTQNPLHKAIFLSYPLPEALPLAPASHFTTPYGKPTHYGKGENDFIFVGFYMIVLSFTREFIMQRVLRPIALRYGIKRQSRFMEQAYTAIYFAIFGPFGLYVMRYYSPLWYFDTTAMFEDFPHRSHEAMFKVYYLLQAAYWAQQAVVLLLQLEAPRKDYKELVGHHIITIALIWCSYRFHFTYMGLAVYITHDVSDFFLATSKVLNYFDSSLTGPYFTMFIFIWAYMRHYLNLKILWSVLTTFRTVGPFELNWDTQQYKCWISQYITFSLLALLQFINLFWFYLILRIAKNYVFYNITEDERSQDEDDTKPAESTNEKRKRMGVEAPPEAVLEKEKERSRKVNPTVLVNGEIPADDSEMGSPEAAVKQRRRSPRRRG